MSLLAPLALLGLLTVPIILLLHLLRSRRKPLAISSLRLWQDLQQKKHGVLPRSIPLSLMLLLQLLAAVGLTLALARPASSFLLDQPEQVIFLLDTTTSMAANSGALNVAGEPAQRFDVARQRLQDYILHEMDDNDSVAVITLARRPELLLRATTEQQDMALLALDNWKAGGNGLNLAAALTLANGLIDPKQANKIVALTDGAFAVDPQTTPPALATIDWQIITGPSSDNQALFNVSSRRMPDGRYRIFARVVNFSDAPVERTLRLLSNGAALDEQQLQIDAQADADILWTVPAPTQAIMVELVEPDALPLDNRAELPLLGATRRQILLISDTPDVLARAFESQPGVDLVARPSNFTRYDPSDFDLIIFDGLPPEQTEWPAGNVLVVNPPLGHPLLPASNFARNLRPEAEPDTPLLAGVDLSGVYFSRAPILIAPPWAQVDLQSQPNAEGQELPLIFHGAIGPSQVMVWGFDLNASNLPARLALPLLTANALSTLLTPVPIEVVLAGEPVLLAGNYSIELPDGRRLTPDGSLKPGADYFFSRTNQPGLYKIYNPNGEEIAGFAVHAGSPLESNLTQQFQPEALAALDAAAHPTPNLEIAFDEFWPLLAALAVVVVTFEGWLAWRR
jgi:hypothetical protein